MDENRNDDSIESALADVVTALASSIQDLEPGAASSASQARQSRFAARLSAEFASEAGL